MFQMLQFVPRNICLSGFFVRVRLHADFQQCVDRPAILLLVVINFLQPAGALFVSVYLVWR